MKRFKLNKKTISLLIGGLVVIVGIIILIVALQPSSSQTSSSGAIPFTTITPNKKQVTWAQINPVNNDPVYAYTDTVSGVTINISEQMLPTSFINDTDGQIAQLAAAFNETDIVTAGSVKVYIGTSIEGPQSVTFTKNGLLVLIKSKTKIQDSAWATYVKSLS